MEGRTFDSAEDFERALVEEARNGAAVLTARGRLARRVLHRFRLRRMREGLSGWPSPPIYGLRRWVRMLHQDLWEPGRPLAKAAALRLWHRTVADEPPPQGLAPSPAVYLQLQEAFDLLGELGMTQGRPDASAQLAQWRASVSRLFRDRLRTEGLWSWPAVVGAVIKAVGDGRLALPDRIILAGFSRPTPLEETLFSALESGTTLAAFTPRRKAGSAQGVRVYASPEQECLAVSAQVLDAWNSGLKKLGVVVLDPAYPPLVARCLDDLAAGEPLEDDALRYNLTVGVPLVDHPLFRTALTPLRILGETDPGPLLASLLSSPYVRPGLASETSALVEVLWERGRHDGAPDAIRALVTAGFPLRPLQEMAAWREKSLGEWLDGLEEVWGALGFPRFAGGQVRVTDALARDHLQAVVSDLRHDAGTVRVRAADAAAWITAAADGIQVIEKTPETAGIQVLSAGEAMGLSFDALWILGCHGRTLPSSARDYPFLSPAERAALPDTTPEGQWTAALDDLEQLLSGSGRIFISRAAQAGDEDPYLASPLLSDEPSTGEGGLSVDLWKAPPDAWLRARWLRGGLEGLAVPQSPASLWATEKIAAGLPPAMTVTGGLQRLMQCPFQFFCGVLAHLDPLPDRPVGIGHMQRGNVVHDVLYAFVEALRRDDLGWPDDGGAVLRLLEETTMRVVDEKAGADAGSPYWAAERARLLGDDRAPGILTEWLETERGRARQGWRFVGAEVTFNSLPAARGRTTLSGRVDRIDAHGAEGLALWDYKTGEPPDAREFFLDFAYPQLPAYAAALMAGRLKDVAADEGPVAGGFIPLKKPSAVAVKTVKDKPRGKEDLDFRAFLPRWEEAVAARLDGPAVGLFAADPRPVPGRAGRKDSGACAYCPYDKLCGYFDASGAGRGADEEDGE